MSGLRIRSAHSLCNGEQTMEQKSSQTLNYAVIGEKKAPNQIRHGGRSATLWRRRTWSNVDGGEKSFLKLNLIWNAFRLIYGLLIHSWKVASCLEQCLRIFNNIYLMILANLVLCVKNKIVFIKCIIFTTI